jgi:RNA polymerase sigma-70 factor (ECF subfamily)
MNAKYTASQKQAVLNEYLVIRCQEGDAEALQQLLLYWNPRLYGYAMGRLRQADAADDVTQECLLSISKGIGGLADPAGFPKWAYQILIRRCADWQRKEMRWRDRHATDLAAANEQAVARTSEVNHDSEQLQNAVAQLQPELSDVVRLYYFESFSVEDIGSLLQLPKGTIKSRLYYARKKLKQALEKNHE